MAEAAEIEIDTTPEAGGEAPAKSGKKGLIIGLAAMLLLGGGGFFAAYSGLIPSPLGGAETEHHAPAAAELPPLAFMSLDQMVISLGPGAHAKHLRFRADVEVEPMYLTDVEMLKPRILDVLNTYLRALEERDLEDPGAMTRIRAQMLRRVQIVTGEGRVRDLLVTEFILQ